MYKVNGVDRLHKHFQSLTFKEYLNNIQIVYDGEFQPR